MSDLKLAPEVEEESNPEGEEQLTFEGIPIEGHVLTVESCTLPLDRPLRQYDRVVVTLEAIVYEIGSRGVKETSATSTKRRHVAFVSSGQVVEVVER